MSPTIKRHRDVVIVVVLLAVPFFVLKANMKSPENQSAMNAYILRVSRADRGRRGDASRAASETSGTTTCTWST